MNKNISLREPAVLIIAELSDGRTHSGRSHHLDHKMHLNTFATCSLETYLME